VVLGSGILYSGVMIILFLPTAWLLHRSALHHMEVIARQRSARPSAWRLRHTMASSTGHNEKKPEVVALSQLSPIAGMGHYVAAFLPVLLGLLPSLLK